MPERGAYEPRERVGHPFHGSKLILPEDLYWDLTMGRLPIRSYTVGPLRPSEREDSILYLEYEVNGVPGEVHFQLREGKLVWTSVTGFFAGDRP